MAQNRRSPFSRWDIPTSGQGVNSVTQTQVEQQLQPMQPSSYTITQQEQQQQFGELKPQAEKLVSETAGMGSLVRQDLNPNDSSYYNCVYGNPNSSQQQFTQQCHVDVGCCETTCCDSNWEAKYTLALILLALFCLAVLCCCCAWGAIWTVNHRKRQKQETEKSTPGEQSQQSAYN